MKLSDKPLDEQDRLELVDSFLHCTHQFFLTETQEETFAQVAELIHHCLGGVDWAILMRHEEGGHLEICQIYIEGEQQVLSASQQQIEHSCGLIDWAVRNSRTLVVDAVEQDTRFNAEVDRIIDKPLHSLAVLPISLVYEAIGAIVIFNHRGLPRFSELEIKFISVVANSAAISIIRARRIESLESAALSDPLTRHLNRRGFVQIIDQEIERCKRYDRTISILMIDVDRFKEINDTYGHMKGDELLHHFSKVLTKSVRKIDYVCRFGGDEFVVLMPDTEYANALEVRQRIEHMVETTSHEISLPYEVSLGLYAGCDGTRDEMLDKADRDLYRIKREKQTKARQNTVASLL